jgi:hypothetical protein
MKTSQIIMARFVQNWRWLVALAFTLAMTLLVADRSAQASEFHSCPSPGVCGRTEFGGRAAKAMWWPSSGHYDFYYVYWTRPGYTSPTIRTKHTSYTVNGARLNTTYSFRVRGCVYKKIFFFKIGERCDQWQWFSANSSWNKPYWT